MKPSGAQHFDQAPRFWRDAAVPFIEARAIADGRKACYARHSHEQFSLGTITAGHSTYVHEQRTFHVSTGSVVLINPGVVHACNPIADQPWSYRMLYVDTPWLTALQQQAGFSQGPGFQPYSTPLSNDPQLFARVNQLYAVLLDEQLSSLDKQQQVADFFRTLHQHLEPASPPLPEPRHKLERAADYIRDNCTRALKMHDICQAAELSASYLNRAFKQQYGMTPHAFLVNQRVQLACLRLRQGAAIAEVAAEAGFADQAHLQRAFKQHLSATPGQYRA